jgi:hypothetical protein
MAAGIADAELPVSSGTAAMAAGVIAAVVAGVGSIAAVVAGVSAGDTGSGCRCCGSLGQAAFGPTMW